MKIVFFTSIFNHHSLPLCDELYRLCDKEFYFVETMKEEEERKLLGYHPYDRPYVIKMLESEENRKKAEELALSADVMIAGMFPYSILQKRLKLKKPTFLCQERMFKGEVSFLRKFKAWLFVLRKYWRYRKNLYLLSIGENSAKDYQRVGFFKKHAFKWAYLTELIEYENVLLKKEKEKVKTLFAGRFIDWKFPNYIVKATKDLLDEGIETELTMIGRGEMQEELASMVKEYKIEDRVKFLGSMSPEKVRDYMFESNILAFTSNSMEGWGAVLNEGMNSGCAVVAGSSAGAVSTLIKDGVNGIVFNAGDYNDFYIKLKKLVLDKKLCNQIGENAYKTIKEDFCARVAAERLVEVSKRILENKPYDIYAENLMSVIKPKTK